MSGAPQPTGAGYQTNGNPPITPVSGYGPNYPTLQEDGFNALESSVNLNLSKSFMKGSRVTWKSKLTGKTREIDPKNHQGISKIESLELGLGIEAENNALMVHTSVYGSKGLSKDFLSKIPKLHLKLDKLDQIELLGKSIYISLESIEYLQEAHAGLNEVTDRLVALIQDATRYQNAIADCLNTLGYPPQNTVDDSNVSYSIVEGKV